MGNVISSFCFCVAIFLVAFGNIRQDARIKALESASHSLQQQQKLDSFLKGSAHSLNWKDTIIGGERYLVWNRDCTIVINKK